MENSRNKQFISFKLHAILSSTMKSHAILLRSTWELHHPLVQHILSISHLVAILVIRLTSLCLYSNHTSFT